jgi:PDZ domain-containing protein
VEDGCLVALPLLLGGCVQHTFAPGPGMSAADFEPDSAQCRLFARGARSGFAFGAVGSPKFVGASMGGASLGYAIGSAVEMNQNFNDCLEARGWRIADSSPPPRGPMAASLVPSEPATPQPARPAAAPQPMPLVAAASQPPIVLASATAPAPMRRAELLVRAVDVTQTLADSAHLSPPRGVMLMSVGIGGAAMVAGLHEGDVILDFNGSPVTGVSDMQRSLNQVAAGNTVVASVWRNGAQRSIEVRF